MESHSYRKTPGVGVPPSAENSTDDSARLCAHVGSKGRRCRVPARAGSELCSFHARSLRASELRAEQANADELLAGIDNFETPVEVQTFMGNLVKLVARRRIERRDAITMAYLCQLLLNSHAVVFRECDRILERKKEADKNKRVTFVWDIPGPARERADNNPPAAPEP